VQEDQLSLAIGRDGQNARLAAKLTGWRIDIKSIVEAAGDTLAKLQSDPALAEQAQAEAERMTHVEEILAKKAENRPVTPEEYQALSQLVDRVERRTVEKQRAEEKAAAERDAAARADIDAAAFEQPLDVLGLPEHVYAILTEAEYLTAGDLILAMKTAPDKVLRLPGVGPKAMQAIEKAVNEASFVVEVAPAPVEAEIAPAAEEPIQTEAEAAPVAEEAPVAEAVVAESVPAAVIEEEDEAEKSFEEMFKLRPEIIKPVGSELELEAQKDKKGKKGKKSVTYERDEASGEVVGKKKHKRGDDWGEE
jgi:N utilization substance protein A